MSVDTIAPVIPMSDVPPSHEVLFLPDTTASHIGEIALGYINTFRQQRAGSNPRQQELERSIEAIGVINPINVTVWPTEMVEEYGEFTHRVWGDSTSVDDLVPIVPGWYVVLSAGHSRRNACQSICEKREIDPFKFGVTSRVHQLDIDGFVGLQASENIHAPVETARRARAYAEAFMWARTKNPKLSRKAFVEQTGITDGAMRDALMYAELPEAIRQFTDTGDLPFSVAAELARALPYIRMDAVDRLKDHGMSEESLVAAIEERVTLDIHTFINRFYNPKKFNQHITNTRTHIREYVKAIKQKFAEQQKDGGELALFQESAYEKPSSEKLRELLEEFYNDRIQVADRLHGFVAAESSNPDLMLDPVAVRRINSGVVALQGTLLG